MNISKLIVGLCFLAATSMARPMDYIVTAVSGSNIIAKTTFESPVSRTGVYNGRSYPMTTYVVKYGPEIVIVGYPEGKLAEGDKVRLDATRDGVVKVGDRTLQRWVVQDKSR